MRSLLLFSLSFLSCLFIEGQCRFAFLTDLHVVPGNANEIALKQVVEEINTDRYDFVVVTGDLSNMGSDAELNAVKSILDQLKYPYYIIPGNHETNWSESAGMTFKRIWGADRFNFSFGNFCFLGYNTGPFMKMGDGLVKNEDLIWLQSQLIQAKRQGKTIISMAHYPLDASISNHQPLLSLLRQYEVPLTFCGHGHKLQMLNFDGVDGVMGRALMDRNQQVGYNQVTMRNDSVLVYEKKAGAEPMLAFSFPLHINVHSTPLLFPAKEESQFLKPLFSHQDSCSVMGGAAMAGNYILFANSCGVVKCHHARTGKLLWQYDTDESVYATPFTNGKLLFVGTIHRGLLAFDLHSGRLKWSLPCQTPVLAEGVTSGNDLYIGLGSDGFACVEASSGRVKWLNSSMTAFMQAKPVLTGDDVLFGAWDTNLYCLNRATGALRWKWNNGSAVQLLSPGNVVPAVAEGKVFLVAPDRHLSVLQISDGKQLMRTKQHQVRESMGMSHDGLTMMAKTMNDSVIFVNTQSLEISAIDCGFGYEHNPCPMVEADGIVYGGTRQGVLFAIDLKSRKYLFSQKLGCSSINNIVKAGKNQIMVSMMEGKVMVLKLH